MADWTPWGIPLIVIGILVIFVVAALLLRWFIRGPMYRGTSRMDGKVVVITGANTGIGLETAKDLVRRGARVVIMCRDVERGKGAVELLKKENSAASVDLVRLDLASLASVRLAAEQVKEKEPKIHVLINNAGVMMCPEWKTTDGFEMQLGTNHLGHFLLTLLLIDNVKAAAPSRIINVSSLAHERGEMYWDNLQLNDHYDPLNAYCQSKLANILFTKKLAQKLEGTGVTTYSLHPGVVHTELGRHLQEQYGKCLTQCFEGLSSIFAKTPVLGAQTTIYCAVDEKLEKETGKYYSDCAEKNSSRRSRNDADAQRLWDLSLDLVGLESDVL